MTARELAVACAKLALDKKAENVLILDLEQKSSVADYFVVCSGMSDRQVAAIGEYVADTLRKAGTRPTNEEGYAEGKWVLIDFGDVILHVFQDHYRDFYSLERLWSEAPRIRVNDSTPSPIKYSQESAHP